MVMRLLTYSIDGHLQLTPNLYGSDIPPYAILSHTWHADDQEVTYHDLTSDLGKAKRGHDKLNFCARQAALDGLQYSWIDTCCIDKSSSTELDEAINSMFRWYQNAKICYVYLADVARDFALPVHVQIQKSRWFTRGWTLQELLAPATVNFFDMNGKPLGDKAILAHEIARITSIPLNALEGNNFMDYSVEERLQWAACRETKREQDGAYCLLGLAGVQMTLRYSETYGDAMRRLRRKVKKNRRETEMIDTEHNAHWIVAKSLNGLFTGRIDLTKSMRDTLLGTHQSSQNLEQIRLVITGMGGQGKSELCVKVANTLRDSFWAVCWVDVSSEVTARSDFVTIAETLHCPAESVGEVVRMLSCTRRRWLLILDNADDPDFDYSVYFPSGSHGAVLITSRLPACERYSTVPSIALEALDLMHSTVLLLKAARIPETSWSSLTPQAQDIVRMLESHTLTMIQAGAYIAGGYCRLDQFADRFERHRKQLLEQYPTQQNSRYQNVYATFEASVEVLMYEENEAGQDGLAVLAVLASLHSSMLPFRLFDDACEGARSLLRRNMDTRQDQNSSNSSIATLKQRFKIFRRPTNKFQALKEVDQVDLLVNEHILQLPAFISEGLEARSNRRFRKACSLLASLSLVSLHQSHDYDAVSMHPLVHAWAKDRLDMKRQQHFWIQTACLAAVSLAGPRKWNSVEKHFQPHFQALTAVSPKKLLPYAPLEFMLPVLIHCGLLLSAVKLYESLEIFLDGLYQALEISPWTFSERYLPIWRLAATTSVCLRRPKLAIHLLEHITDIDAATADSSDPQRLSAQYSLGRAYNDNGEPGKAIPLLKRIIETYETISTHQDWLLSSQLELNRAYTATCQTQEAVELLEHVAATQEHVIGPDSQRDYLRTQHGLGLAYIANGQIEEAISLLEHVVTMYKRCVEETHLDLLSSQHELARAYNANKEFERALPLLVHVTEIQSQTLKPANYLLITAQYTLGTTHLALGQVTEAVPKLEHVVEMYNQTLDETQSERLSAQYSLALAYVDTMELEKATLLVRHVVEVRRKTLELGHPHRIQAERLLKDIEDGTVYD
ncbi:HET-domain-containing protein [Phaeosphaeriaceae sp. SRC1lsM3a]|nr:HET-domain-containing protein [Stagonospora sp. SRC1lsM3a]